MSTKPRLLVLPSRGHLFLRDLFWLTIVLAAAGVGYVCGSREGNRHFAAPKKSVHEKPQPGFRDTSMLPIAQERIPG